MSAEQSKREEDMVTERKDTRGHYEGKHGSYLNNIC